MTESIWSQKFSAASPSGPWELSGMLGHATIALTLDTYSHVIPSLQLEAAKVVAAAVLDPAATAPQPGRERQVRAITSGS